MDGMNEDRVREPSADSDTNSWSSGLDLPYYQGGTSADRDINIVRVSIPALSRFVAVARQTIESVCAETEMPVADRAAVRLAVGEACNNAVLHATNTPGQLAPLSVDIVCRIEPHVLEIEVSNDGSAKLPTMGNKMPDPLSEHGRGMVLIEAMMDSVEFRSHNGRTTVRMRKAITPAPR